MKVIKTLFLSIVLLFAMTIIGCNNDSGDEEQPDPLTEQLIALMNEGSLWRLSSLGVEKDGLDVTSQFDGFTLTIGNKTFSTTNSLDSAWPSSGTWDFDNGNANRIIRSDGVLIFLTLSGNTLTLTFTTTGTNIGERRAGIAGEYRFHLISN